MSYVVIGLIVVVVAALALGAHHIREENSPGQPPSLVAARRALGKSRLITTTTCVCGGTLGPTGLRSRRFGLLLGCTDCDRTWAENGRQVIRRRPAPRTRRISTRRQPPGDSPQDT